MHIGLVGLGKMGNNMRERLRRGGVEVTGYDPNPAVTDVPDLPALAAALPTPRVVWVMVPSGAIGEPRTAIINVATIDPREALGALEQAGFQVGWPSMENDLRSMVPQ